jgi:hypothetical protein
LTTVTAPGGPCENFHAIESMIAERVEQQQPQPEGE